jgi:outer membrane protein assembly factor BamB
MTVRRRSSSIPDRSSAGSPRPAGVRASRRGGAPGRAIDPWSTGCGRGARRVLRDATVLVAVLAVALAACGGSSTPPATREAGTPVTTGENPTGLVADGDALLVLHEGGALVRVSADGQVEQLADGPTGLGAPVVAFGSLWAVRIGAGGTDMIELEDGGAIDAPLDAVVRVDPSDGSIQATVDGLGSDLRIAATDDALWVVGERLTGGGWVWRIDPDTEEVTTVQEGDGVRGDSAISTQVLAVGERLWLTGNCDAMPCPDDAERVRVIDPGTGEVTLLDTALPDDLLLSGGVAADGLVWMAGFLLGEELEGSVVAIDETGAVVHDVTVGRLPGGLAVGADGLLVTDCLDGTLSRLDPTDGTAIQPPIVVGDPYPPDEPFDWYREDYACPGPVVQAGDTIWVVLLDGTLIPVR